MKRYRTQIVLAALALVLGATYFWVTAREGVEDTGVAFALKSGEEITAVSLKNEFGAFSFTPAEGGWTVEHGGASYRVNDSKMSLLLSSLQTLQVSRVLDEARPEYGLDAPRASVEISTSAGRRYAFSLGEDTASRSGVYLLDGEGRVMVGSAGTAAQLTGSLAAYRAKDVFSIDKGHIRALSYYEDGACVVSAENDGVKNWFMTYPYEAPARAIELNELASALRDWTVAGYPENADYAAMGLDDSGTWLDVTDADGKTQRFVIGAPADGTTTYVRTGGEEEVVRLYTSDLDFSMMKPDKLVFVAPLKTTTDQISTMTVETADVKYVFDVEQVEGGQRVTCGGREIGESDFASVFFKYIAMNADGRAPGDPLDTAPAAVLTTTFLDGTTAELRLLPRDGETYFMLVDGKTEYWLPHEDLEQLLYRIEKALGNIE